MKHYICEIIVKAFDSKGRVESGDSFAFNEVNSLPKAKKWTLSMMDKYKDLAHSGWISELTADGELLNTYTIYFDGTDFEKTANN